MVNAEYKRRATSQRVNEINSISRAKSIILVVLLGKTGQSPDSTYIIEKYNHSTNCFEKFIEIILKMRTNCGVVLHNDKIYFLGGKTHAYHNSKKHTNIIEWYDMNDAEYKRHETSRRVDEVALKESGPYYGGYDDLAWMTSFDLNSRQKEVLPEMKFPRRRFGAISLGKCIYVFGGLQTDDGNLISYTTSCER